MAVLAALWAEPAGMTVAVIAGHAGISVPAAWQALIAQEKNGTATGVEVSRPGISVTWTPAAPEAPHDQDLPAAPGQVYQGADLRRSPPGTQQVRARYMKGRR